MMKNKFVRTAISAAVFSLISTQAMAGSVITEGEDIIIKTKGGFEAKTASEDFTFKLGGRVQVQYDTYQDAMNLIDNEGDRGSDMFIRRARVYLKGTMYNDWAYKIQFNVADAGSGGGTFEDLYVKWQRFKWANIIVGKHKEPFSLQELTSSKWVTTVERAAIDDFIAEGRSLGISLQGVNNFWGYAIGVYDNQDKKDDSGKQLLGYTGRVHLSPINSERALLHVGLGVSARDSKNSDDFYDGGSVTQGIKKGDEVSFGVDNTESQVLFNVEAAGKIGPFHASAEYHQRDTKAATNELGITGEDASANGYYVQAGWFITGESRTYKKGRWNKIKPNRKGVGAWEIFARYEGLDGEDDGISAATQNTGSISTIGANWYANEIIRISANYVYSTWDQPLASVEGDLVTAAPGFVGITEDTGQGFAIRMQAAF
jgi:phosphate-selective porin OprO/OprP